ncbi:MAG: CopG family transcriptional regulator [Pseudonocardiaceae bacterium]
MCMSEFERRLQLLLDQDRYERVSAAARARGVSVSAVIRDAIDRGLDMHPDNQGSALRIILDADTAHVPENPDELVNELHEMRGARNYT